MPGPGPRSQVQVPGLRPESRGGGEKRRELSVAMCVQCAWCGFTPSLHLDLNMDTVGVSLRGRHVRVFVARNASAYCGGSFLSKS
jgi:hypothetical protein